MLTIADPTSGAAGIIGSSGIFTMGFTGDVNGIAGQYVSYFHPGLRWRAYSSTATGVFRRDWTSQGDAKRPMTVKDAPIASSRVRLRLLRLGSEAGLRLGF